MRFAIIPARPENAQILAEIAISAKRSWKYPETWIQIWIPALTISPEYISDHETWMAVVNKKPIAFYSLKQDKNDLWLDNLWVLPEFMGQGIGRQLFQHALERSRARNTMALKIESDPNAAGFYEKMGAYKTDERHSEVDDQKRIIPVMEINLLYK